MRGLDRLAEARHHELGASLRTERQQRFGGLVPSVHRQAERSPMHRKERATTEQRMRFECVLGAQVDVPPGRVERADLQHHQVEWTEALADDGVLGRQSGVAAEEY